MRKAESARTADGVAIRKQRACGLMAEHGASVAGETRTALEELRRIASDTGYSVRLATGRVQLPDATPTDGPDPYGNPDPEWLRIDWRSHRRQIDVVGARANYVEMGEGPPLLLVHGLSGAWQNWLEQLPALSVGVWLRAIWPPCPPPF